MYAQITFILGRRRAQMGYFEYRGSQELALKAGTLAGNGFYSLIMAAMREADTDNLELLKSAFPETFIELQARINAPGGFLPGERTE